MKATRRRFQSCHNPPRNKDRSASTRFYYAGLAELQLGRHAEACRLFRRVQERGPIGYLVEAAALAEAECAEAAKDYGAAIAIYERLLLMKTAAPDEILMRLGGAAKADRDFAKAGMALGRVYFEFPRSRLAPLAGSEYASLPIVQRIAPGTERYKLELGRAERLFRARLYAEALQAYETLRASASGGDGELVNLRIAECHYFQGAPQRRARRRKAIHQQKPPDRPKHCSSTLSQSAISEIDRSTSGPYGASSPSFRQRGGLRKRWTTLRRVTSEATRTPRPTRPSASCTRDTRLGRMRPAPRGRLDGAPTGRDVTQRRFATSSARPLIFRGPITAHRGCTGPAVRAIS